MSQSISEKAKIGNLPISKSSFVWQYFIDTAIQYRVKCIKCNKLCSYKKASTGNLLRHMKLKHRELYDLHYQGNKSIAHSQDENQLQSQNISVDETSYAIDKITKDTDNSENIVQTMEIQSESILESPNIVSVNEEQDVQTVAYYLVEQNDVNQLKEIDNQFLKLVAKEFYPTSLSENQEFKSFVSMLNSNYTLPNYKFLSSELLLKTYESKVQQLKSTLKEIKYISLIIDNWISVYEENFIAVIAHYLNKDLILKSSLLDCISFHKNSSVNIPVFLQELVGKWKVSNKIVAVLSENDPTIVEAIKECQWQHISCFAHILNKIIITSLAKINGILTKLRNIVDYLKRIPNAEAQIQSYQNEMGLDNVKLKRDDPNRWNSTFDMITSSLKNKDLLNSQLIKELPEELSFNDWLILEDAVKLLVVFNTITIEMCSENVVSLSKVPYMIKFMMKHVTNVIENTSLQIEIKKMGETLNKLLHEQSTTIEANHIICQSVLLDPRLKRRGFSDNSFNTAYSSLLKDVISLKKENMHKIWIEKHSKEENPQEEYFIDVWSEFRKYEKPPERDFTPNATAEIDAFLSEAYLSTKDNPMTYWGNEINQNKFPILFELVKGRFCAPAACAPCKNIFSEEGNALTERRSFLSSKYSKEVLFLHHNL